jgi:hypothetical protein
MAHLPPIGSPPVGAFRFNDETNMMEYYNGNEWMNITSTSPDVHTGGTRAVRMGGNLAPNWINNIDYWDIATGGDATDFGDLANNVFGGAVVSSRTRGLYGGGYKTPTHSGSTTQIERIEFSSPSNGIDFNDLTQARMDFSGMSNQTRGVMAGGTNNPGGGWTSYNIIDYVTIASAANAVDFGDIAAGASSQPGSNGAASPTRGVFASGSQQADISMITIASAGNTTDWGDMNMGNATVGSDSNAIRVIYAGAYNSTKIKYSTIATNGDAVDFGDTTVKKYIPAVAASSTRACIAGGKQQPSPGAMENGIEYIQIMSEGNSIDFGNLTQSVYNCQGLSNGHGGLG